MLSICDILKTSRTIAVVGISDKTYRDSYIIAKYLQKAGYSVVGVNPFLKNVESIPVYPTLKDIPHKVDIVDVFRNSDAIPELVEDVISIKPKAFWLQLGIHNAAAVEIISNAGIEVIQNSCIMVEHINNCL